MRLPRPSGRSFRSRNPVPIGAVFLVVVLLAMYLSFDLGKLSFLSGPSYSAAFSEAAGLHKGDKVRVGGVDVGMVSGVTLERDHVRVAFTVKDSSVHLGDQTRASIQIFTLLGNKYLALEPRGTGRWPRGRELPLSRTSSPYDVEPAFQDLTRTAAAIDVDSVARSLDTFATTFRTSPAALRGMLDGLGRLSQTIASRDSELSALLHHASVLTGVLADRRTQFAQLFGDGSAFLQMVSERRAVIAELLSSTVDLSNELVGLVRDNSAAVTPLLAHLHGVLKVLDDNQDNLDKVIKGLYVFVRGEVDATGAGPWFDGIAINVTNPFHAGTTAPVSVPKTLGDLLGVPVAATAVQR